MNPNRSRSPSEIPSAVLRNPPPSTQTRSTDTGGPRAPCAVPGCGTVIPAARIFCQAHTNELDPRRLQAIAEAYEAGLSEQQIRARIWAAIDSLRPKKNDPK